MSMNDTYTLLLGRTGPTASPAPYTPLDAELLSLADDTFVDVLFTYLNIPDLYRVRRVRRTISRHINQDFDLGCATDSSAGLIGMQAALRSDSPTHGLEAYPSFIICASLPTSSN